MGGKSPSSLRQKLRAKVAELPKIVRPAFERGPVFPGRLSSVGVRCGKARCRCARGELHRSPRLQIRFQDGAVTRSLSDGGIEFWRARVEAYREMREVRRNVMSRWSERWKSLEDTGVATIRCGRCGTRGP